MEQVKGHGLAGFFKLDRIYNQQKFYSRSKKQKIRTSEKFLKKTSSTHKTETKDLRDKDTCWADILKYPVLVNITVEEHDYCTTRKNNKVKIES